MLIACKCMPLCNKLDCEAKFEPPYLATTHMQGLGIMGGKFIISSKRNIFFCNQLIFNYMQLFLIVSATIF
jgi:hypothetical protein